MIGLFLAAMGGLIFANIVTCGQNRKYRAKRKRREERKRLGKKWYDD